MPADAFYRNALSEIAQSPDAELRLETRVLEIVDLEDGAVVYTNHGEIYAKRVFDSRPRVNLKDRNTGHIDLQQHFVGWHVKTKDNVFDPNVVTLMDFKERDEALIQFFYVLPFAHDEALVEATFISRTTLPEEHYEHELQSYLEDLGSSDGYRVLWKERGRIPMSTRPTPTRVSPHVYTIGGAAGLVKPSTGYGFLGIQRYSQALASRLTSASLPQPPRVRSRLMATLDRIFLSVIDRYPALAPSIFSTLFQGVDADALVRFLSDRPQPSDVMAVVNAMPKWPFIRQAFLSAPVWLSP